MESLQTFLFIIQIVLSVLIILFVLLQQTDEDSLSGIGGGGANAKMLSKRSSSTPVSKTTMALFILFMLNSMFLATISARNFSSSKSTIESFIENKTTTENKTNNVELDTKVITTTNNSSPEK